MRKFILSVLIYSIISTLGFSSIMASSYYVSNSGNNLSNGSIDTPWKSIQFGMDQLSPGDYLFIRGGTYFEKVNITVSGTIDERIYIGAYQNENVILDGTGNTSTITSLNIGNQSYITIDGLHVTNNIMNYAQGILIDGSGDGLYLVNNKVSNINFSSDPGATVLETTNAQGIIVFGKDENDPITDLQIQGNEVFDCMLGQSEALAVNGNVDGFSIINNSVYDNTNIGIDIIGHEETADSNDQARNGIIRYNLVYNCAAAYATSGGIYVDGGKDLIIENNEVYLNGYGIEIGCENMGKTTSNITVRNNLIYNNEVAGLSLGGFSYPSSGKVIDCLISGNTFYKNDNTNSYNGEMYLSYSENCSFQNNIFYLSSLNTLAYVDISQLNLELNYNNYYLVEGENSFEVSWNGASYDSFSSYKTGTGQDLNSHFGNPMFVDENIAAPDLHISASSEAINKGNPSYVTTDFDFDLDKNERVEGSIVDCGAHEYGASEPCQDVLSGVDYLNSAQSYDQIYSSMNEIESTQNILGSNEVEYHSLISIELLPGFETFYNAGLTIDLDGCN